MLKPDTLPAALMIEKKLSKTLENQNELPLAKARQIAVDEFERIYLSAVLTKHKGKIGSSAKEAGITTRQLSRLVAKHGLDKREYKH